MLNRALKESLTIGVERVEDSQMTESFATPGNGDQTLRDRRMFTPSFNFGTPNDSGASSWGGRRSTRSAARRGLDLSVDTDGNPDLSLDSSDDADMSTS